MKPCKKYEERISEMLFGEIPENEAHVLHIHMAGCEGCMNFYLSLYETLEADENADFSLSDTQKNEIFEVAEKLDKPIKKFSSFWTTGVSIAASVIVSGIIILTKGSSNKEAYGYFGAKKSKASEIEVVLEEVEELQLPEPEESITNEMYGGKLPAPKSEFKKSESSPVLTTVEVDNVSSNDVALEDVSDELPSVDDSLIEQAVSNVVVSPSAFATPSVLGGRSARGIAEKKNKEQQESQEGEGKEESLDLVLDGTVPANEKFYKNSMNFADKGKDEKNNGIKYEYDALGKKGETLKFELGYTIPGGGIAGEEDQKDINGIGEIQFQFRDGYVSSEVDKNGKFDDKGGSTIWYSINSAKDASQTPQQAQGNEKDDLKDAEALFGSRRYIESRSEVEKVLADEPFNKDALSKLEEINEKIFESGQTRRKRIYSEDVDKVGQSKLDNESEIIVEKLKDERANKADLSKVEEALKQQRELEADNKFLNAQRLQRDGDVNGAKEELEKAIAKISELASNEKRIQSKKEKYQELYSSLVEVETAKRPMLSTQAQPMSTFSIDVDTASYQIAKQMIQSGKRPNPLSIRAEEFINSFDYKYDAPKSKAFAVQSEVVNSPFHRGSKIMKIGVQGKRPGGDHRAASHFCFIIDTSGSMADKNRLPMVKKVLPMIVKQMSPGDKVSLVSCGLNSRLELDHIDVQNAEYVAERISSLNAVGATNLEASLIDGYKQVLKHTKKGTYSRVVLFSDGVANLGEQNAENILKKLSHAKSEGVGITVIGMGEEEYNDNFLETLADKGDGNYVYIGNNKEAQKTFEEKFAATFHTIAYNVKIQVEFDPTQVSKYRLLGYENRRLKNKDFRNDKVDAGEVGSGQSVTAIYEVEMTGKPSSEPMAEVRLRYRDAVDSQMKEFATPVLQKSYNIPFEKSSKATRLAFISGKFAEVLRDGGNSEGISMDSLLKFIRPLASEINDEETVELKNLIEKSK